MPCKLNMRIHDPHFIFESKHAIVNLNKIHHLHRKPTLLTQVSRIEKPISSDRETECTNTFQLCWNTFLLLFINPYVCIQIITKFTFNFLYIKEV